MTFCSTCGARLAGPPPVTCASCGAEHYRNAKPCAGVLITDGDRLLLMRRAHEPWLDHWDIPGGFCEVDEHPAATAVREAREETGLAVEVTGFLGIWLDRYPDPARTDEPATTLNVYYLARPVAGAGVEVPDAAETVELAWFPPDGLPTPIAFPGHALDVLAAWRAVLAGTPPAQGDRDRPPDRG